MNTGSGGQGRVSIWQKGNKVTQKEQVNREGINNSNSEVGKEGITQGTAERQAVLLAW